MEWFPKRRLLTPSTQPEPYGNAVHAPLGSRRGWLSDLETQDAIPFHFAPKPIHEGIRVNYAKQYPVGMSHGYHNYQYTDNQALTFDLWWHRLLLAHRLQREADEVDERMVGARQFLESLCYPGELPTGVMGGSPAPALLVIPNIVTMRVRLMSLDITFEEQDAQGRPFQLRAAVAFEEAPLGRITAADQRINGSFRSYGARASVRSGVRWMLREEA
jgi:hypothetical protein